MSAEPTLEAPVDSLPTDSLPTDSLPHGSQPHGSQPTGPQSRPARPGASLEAMSGTFARALARARHPQVLAAGGTPPRGAAGRADPVDARRRTYLLLGTVARLRAARGESRARAQR